MRVVRGYSIAVLLACAGYSPASAGISIDGLAFNGPSYSNYLDLNEVLGTEIGNARRAFLNPVGNYRFEVLGNAAVRMGGALSEIRPLGEGAISDAAKIVIRLLDQAALGGRNFIQQANWRLLPWGFSQGFMRPLPTLHPSVKAVEYAFPQADGNVLVVDVQGKPQNFDELVRSLTSLEKL